MCASPIFVIIPICGLINLERLSISPFLLIPISKIPYLSSTLKLDKLIGTPK